MSRRLFHVSAKDLPGPNDPRDEDCAKRHLVSIRRDGGPAPVGEHGREGKGNNESYHDGKDGELDEHEKGELGLVSKTLKKNEPRSGYYSRCGCALRARRIKNEQTHARGDGTVTDGDRSQPARQGLAGQNLVRPSTVGVIQRDGLFAGV